MTAFGKTEWTVQSARVGRAIAASFISDRVSDSAYLHQLGGTGLWMSVAGVKPECAGRPARSRWCKSITLKE